MCVPGCFEALSSTITRRQFVAGTAIATLAGCMRHTPVKPSSDEAASPKRSLHFDRVLDLTHLLHPEFPTYSGKRQFSLRKHATLAKDHFNAHGWTLHEHTGTHVDAPYHFTGDGRTLPEIPAEELVCPLVILDVRAAASESADYALTPKDIRAWEQANGKIPHSACVAMWSGWDSYVTTPKFRNADSKGGMHFPGFHAETAHLLVEERAAVGIAVDTLSLDIGASHDFGVHTTWLPAGRWGIECIANLGSLPASGATIVVGMPKVEGATGGPTRVLGLA